MYNTPATDNSLLNALQKYCAGEISAWKAATIAKVTLWDFLDFLKQKDVGFKSDEVELKKQLGDLKKKLRQSS